MVWVYFAAGFVLGVLVMFELSRQIYNAKMAEIRSKVEEIRDLPFLRERDPSATRRTEAS
jgi:hypothetical protein